MASIGITERGDAALTKEWYSWVYKNHQPAILITKDPRKLVKENRSLFFGEVKGNVILHATITGLGGTPIEPGVTNYKEQLNYLSDCLQNPDFHRERLVIRQDPLIPFFIQDPEYQGAVTEIAKFASNNGLRYRISFLDYYNHVKDRFAIIKEQYPRWTVCINNQNKYQTDLHIKLSLRESFLQSLIDLGIPESIIEICGEPGMKCTGCISQRDLDIFGISVTETLLKNMQRPACACLGIKYELLNNKHPCAHNCAYCYWK